MTYKISLYGKGNEFVIGKIKPETWQYIQDTFGGSESDYCEALDNGDVPEEHQLAENSWTFYESDDIYHHDGCWSNYYRCEVTDENDDTVCEFTNDNPESIPVDTETEFESVSDIEGEYIFTWSSMAKGLYLAGSFETDEPFDPEKLILKFKRVSYNQDDWYDEIVTGFSYDGQDIDAEFESSDGKGDTLTFMEVGKDA